MYKTVASYTYRSNIILGIGSRNSPNSSKTSRLYFQRYKLFASRFILMLAKINLVNYNDKIPQPQNKATKIQNSIDFFYGLSMVAQLFSDCVTLIYKIKIHNFSEFNRMK